MGYTYTTSEQGNTLAGGYSSLPGLPSNRVNASVDVHPANKPFGASFTVFWVGDIFDNVSGFGKVASGNYTVADLGRPLLSGRAAPAPRQPAARESVRRRLRHRPRAWVSRCGRSSLCHQHVRRAAQPSCVVHLRVLASSPWCKSDCIRRAMHPLRRRCSSLKYSRYSRSSRLAGGAPHSSRCDARLPPRAASE